MRRAEAIAAAVLLLFVAVVPAQATTLAAGAGAKADERQGAQVEAHARTGAFVDPVLLAAFETDPEQVAIIAFDGSREDDVVAGLASLGLDHHVYPELDMASLALPFDELEGLLEIPGLTTVYRNERMHESLSRSVPYVGANVVWSTYKVTGKGATILIVDSGIDATHPDLRFRETVLENVVPVSGASGLVDGYREGVVSSDPDGHGTHAASIAAGSGRANPSGRYKGVAPEARIVGFQAGLDDGSGDVSFQSLSVLEAFNYALAKRRVHGIQVVSNSWGANGDFDPQSPVNQATLSLYKAGLVVVFAAGNEGKEGTHTLNRYSVAPWVLSVTAGDYLNQRPDFASRGEAPGDGGAAFDHPDLMAPGVGITAAKAVPSNANAAVAAPNPGDYTAKSGTSMAAPHVAGIAALLLSANPNLSPDDVMDVLTATATPLAGAVWDVGAGYANALNAYQLAVKTAGHRQEFLGGKVKYAGRESGDPGFERDPVSVGYGAGAARQIVSMDRSLDEFAHQLVSTIHGVVFLIGATALSLASFGPGRRKG